MIKSLCKLKKTITLVIVSLVTVGSIYAYGGGDTQKGTASSIKDNPAFLYLNFNKMFMPINNAGIIADAGSGIPSDLARGAKGGRLGGPSGNVFLFSGGFFLSGFSNDTVPWGNGVMSASKITDYVPGSVGSTPSDSKNKIYLVTVQDQRFGTSWQDWKNAVANGADFYDGDHDGKYNPVDKNSNGIWDSDEDRPDLIGDFTAWCVYNDNLASSDRIFKDVAPQGIEIHQSVFGFISKYFDDLIGNMLFIRYRLVNKGTVCDTMKQVYFSAVCDPDIGDSGNDLVGCDTALSAGYVYNNGSDNVFGNQPPCFIMDFFQGPVSYIPGKTFTDNNNNGVYDNGIDTPLKWAANVKGNFKGVDSIAGAMNLPLTSFTQYMQSHPSHGDPSTQDMLRNYLIGGRAALGTPISACTWSNGNGSTLANCAEINPKFMYSGNPVKGTGWINSSPIDQRMMSNSGSFNLVKNKPIDIIVAYIVATGNNALDAVTVAKSYDVAAQKIFNSNFTSFPNDVKESITPADGFELGQNYPNPFNPNTTINYTVPATGKVILKVYDLLGKEVAELVNDVKLKGTYEVNFDASKLSSGMYIYSITAGSYSSSKKMMLLK